MKGKRMIAEHETQTDAKRLRKIMLGCLLAGFMAAPIPARAADKPTVVVSLTQLNNEIHKLREDLSRTMAALEGVKAAARDNTDLAKPYASFSSAFGDLEEQTAKVRKHGTATKARAKEHWEAWQKELTEMQNPKLREKAQKRYSATSGEFEKISERVAEAKEDFAPLVADIKDIHTYLQTDLSKDAISSLSNTIWKMGGQAHSVDGKLADVNKQIEKAISKMPQS